MTDAVIERLVAWGEARDDVRAMILTSSRASAIAQTDAFSDYDVIVAVTEVQNYIADKSWLSDFGPVLVVYHDPPRQEAGGACVREITQYEDGVKIDFDLWAVDVLRRVGTEPQLPADLDVGYRVLLDKDALTSDLPPPTYRAFVPKPPSERVYQTVVEEFFQEGTYVAKHLSRGDWLPAKYNLDYAMKFVHLKTMLIWRYQIDVDWSVPAADYGKGLKRRVSPELWSRFESTYTGAGLEDNWNALFATVALFRDVAREVGHRLGYAYPEELDRRCVQYFERVRSHRTPSPR